MFGYSNDLRSMTQGKGSFSMEFLKYQKLPSRFQEEIVKKATARQGDRQGVSAPWPVERSRHQRVDPLANVLATAERSSGFGPIVQGARASILSHCRVEVSLISKIRFSGAVCDRVDAGAACASHAIRYDWGIDVAARSA